MIDLSLLCATQADEYMAKIATERIVGHLQDARFVVMRRPPI
jgi:hypothetical protein